MDARDYVRRQIARVWRLCDAVLDDLTDDQLAWTPPGTANSIGVIFVHVFSDDDLFIQTILQGQPRLWDAAGWGDRLGLTTPPVNDRGWDETQRARLTVPMVRAYGQAVRAASDAYLTRLSTEELDRPVEFDGIRQPAAEVLAALVAHTVLHLGEVAAIKGLRGGRGFPF